MERRIEAEIIGPGAPGCVRARVGTRESDFPLERIPHDLRRPNARFIIVVKDGELIRVERAGAEWLGVYNRIRDVLNTHWDPIGVADQVPDEYDDYIGGIHTVLMRGASPEELSAHLLRIETDAMGFEPHPADRCLEAGRRLHALALPRLSKE